MTKLDRSTSVFDSLKNAKLLQSKLVLPLMIVAGIFLFILIVKVQPEMQHQPQGRSAVAVNVITVTRQSLRPMIVGFGVVEPDLTLQAKAEVQGRVTYIHPELKKGAVLKKDTVVIKIDDKDYLLALKQAQADLLSNRANLNEIQLTIENTKLDLKLANEKLKVRNKEFKRLEKLRKSGSVSQSKLDSERQNLLQQKQEVQQLENKQTTLPSEVAVLEAKIEISQAKVEQSQRDLERTVFALPFTARVRQVEAEQDQYVGLGALLFDVSGLDKIVINAQFPADRFREITLGFDRSKINFENIAEDKNMSDIFRSLGLSAKATIAGSLYQGWEAKVERISDSIDPQTRTIGVMVSVSDSYKNIDPGVRPPLLEGNYMQVELRGPKQEYVALPRFALHQQQVYRVTKEDKLQRVELNDIQLQGELALVREGLNLQERIITSDVFPAVNGMSVKPFDDVKSKKQLELWLESAQ